MEYIFIFFIIIFILYVIGDILEIFEDLKLEKEYTLERIRDEKRRKEDGKRK